MVDLNASRSLVDGFKYARPLSQRIVRILTPRLKDLETIREEISANPDGVSPDTRKQFWKLVRQIKREETPNEDEVKSAAQVRDLLFDIDRGKTYSIGPWLGLQTVGGIVAFLVFLYGLATPVDWLMIVSWSLTEIGAVVLRFLGLFFVVALLYPYGRLIAGKALGIEVMGMCFDEYREPTIRIDYVSFLMAPPPRRKWFFFISGLWTLTLSLLVGAVGFFRGGDILGFAFGVFLILFYARVISSGTTSHGRGEMAHYNREKKIEKAWKKKPETDTQSSRP
jgi:hypothetical protein